MLLLYRTPPPFPFLRTQFLGIPRTADSNAINRIYKQRLFEAKSAEAKQAIEDAHGRIMMSMLTQRMKGGVTVGIRRGTPSPSRSVFGRLRLFRAAGSAGPEGHPVR